MACGKVLLHLADKREGFAHIQAPVAAFCCDVERMVVLQFVFRVSKHDCGAVAVGIFMTQRYDRLDEAAVCGLQTSVSGFVYECEKLGFRQYEVVHSFFHLRVLHLFVDVRTLTYSANRLPTNEKKSVQIYITLTYNKINFENIFLVDFNECEMCSESEHVFTF